MPAESAWERRIRPDDVLLFRYSALTFNGHPFSVHGQPSPDGKTVRLWGRDHEGWPDQERNLYATPPLGAAPALILDSRDNPAHG